MTAESNPKLTRQVYEKEKNKKNLGGVRFPSSRINATKPNQGMFHSTRRLPARVRPPSLPPRFRNTQAVGKPTNWHRQSTHEITTRSRANRIQKLVLFRRRNDNNDDENIVSVVVH